MQKLKIKAFLSKKKILNLSKYLAIVFFNHIHKKSYIFAT